MIEVFGKDGKAFRFQDGTPDDVIKTALDKHYGSSEQPSNPETAQIPVREPVAAPEPVQAPASSPELEAAQPQATEFVAPTIIPASIRAPPPIVAQPLPLPPIAPANDEYFRHRDAEPATDIAMQLTKMVGAGALGVLAVTAILWSTGMVGKKPVQIAPSPPQTASTQFQATPQPDLRQALVGTQIRKDAASNGAVMREMVAGATVDVLGEQTITGVTWVRVRLDQTSSDVGYVVASHLGAMGTAAPGLSVVSATETPASVSAVAIPSAPPPTTGLEIPTVGRASQTVVPVAPAAQSNVAAIPATTYFVVSEQLNIRAAATPNAARVARINFGTRVVADAQANHEGRIWLRVRAGGVTGWVNSDLVSQSQASAPIDQPQYAAPPPGRYIPTAPAYRNQATRSGNDVRVIALNANIRSEPSSQGGNDTVIDVAAQDDILYVSRAIRLQGKTWYMVTSAKNIRGWISEETVVPSY